MPVIRLATPEDFITLGEIMYAAIHTDDSPYTPEQRQAWLSQPHSGHEWAKRLSDQTIWMAEDNGSAHGFMSITAENHIDLAFILEAARGQGLFRRLHQQVEKTARAQSTKIPMTTHASLAAKSAFEAVGYVVRELETVKIEGESLKRFDMCKML